MSWAMFEAVAGAPIVSDPGRRVSVDRARMVLVYLAARANDDGVAWPSVRNIAAYHGISSGSARTALRVLEEQKLIEVDGRRSGGRTPTRYRVTPTHRTPGALTHQVPGALADGQPTGAPVPIPPGVATQPTGAPVPNTTNHPNVSEGGGGGEGQLPAPDGAVAALLDAIADRIPDTVQVTPAIEAEVARLFDLDWGALTIAAHVTADWPRKVKSSATGILTHRLRAITEPPSFDLACRVAQEYVAGPFSVIEACRHTGTSPEGWDLTRAHVDAFFDELYDVDDDTDIGLDEGTGETIIAARDMESLRRVVALVDRYARLCREAA